MRGRAGETTDRQKEEKNEKKKVSCTMKKFTRDQKLRHRKIKREGKRKRQTERERGERKSEEDEVNWNLEKIEKGKGNWDRNNSRPRQLILEKFKT